MRSQGSTGELERRRGWTVARVSEGRSQAQVAAILPEKVCVPSAQTVDKDLKVVRAIFHKTLLVAVGLEFAARTRELHEGDEVSIMPPVQGG